MKTWGVAIPGLAMNAKEIPLVEGLTALQNPGFAGTETLPDGYTIEDVAGYHLDVLQDLLDGWDSSHELTIIGMSMGGMVAAVLGSKYRQNLPPRLKLRFLMTSANTTRLKCIPDSMLKSWYGARPGDVESFSRILSPFVGQKYKNQFPDETTRYYQYRANGLNEQSNRNFICQMQAVRSFDGTIYFSALDPTEIQFYFGSEDRVMNHLHQQDLMRIQPKAWCRVLEGVGHMANFEAPYLFSQRISHDD
jgi:pimeloyl-ACP methyl ester carboxylesterase